MKRGAAALKKLPCFALAGGRINFSVEKFMKSRLWRDGAALKKLPCFALAGGWRDVVCFTRW